MFKGGPGVHYLPLLNELEKTYEYLMLSFLPIHVGSLSPVYAFSAGQALQGLLQLMPLKRHQQVICLLVLVVSRH